MKHTKQTAGHLGGRATVAKHGREHMQEIGKRGAATTWTRYQLSPIGHTCPGGRCQGSGWAMVDRETRQVKTFTPALRAGACVNFIPRR